MTKADEWRNTTYGQMYDLKLARLGDDCDDFKKIVMRIPSAGDLTVKEMFDKIQSALEDLRKIRSDGGLPVLIKKLGEK